MHTTATPIHVVDVDWWVQSHVNNAPAINPAISLIKSSLQAHLQCLMPNHRSLLYIPWKVVGLVQSSLVVLCMRQAHQTQLPSYWNIVYEQRHHHSYAWSVPCEMDQSHLVQSPKRSTDILAKWIKILACLRLFNSTLSALGSLCHASKHYVTTTWCRPCAGTSYKNLIRH